jgi:hypothetical protein
MWAWVRERLGCGWVRIIRLRGRRGVADVVDVEASISSDEGRVEDKEVGAFLAAWAERCRVMLFGPMRMCELISGGGGGAVSVVGLVETAFWERLRFLPLEGGMC